MPTYEYACSTCAGTAEGIYPIGEAPRSVPGVCGHDIALVIGAGVQVAPSALESRGGEVRDLEARDARWDIDMPAYQRMRWRGMQPKGIDGSSKLENEVGDQLDIDHKNLLDQGVSRSRLIEGVQQAAEIMAEGVPAPWS